MKQTASPGAATLRGILRTRDDAQSGAKSGGRAVTQKASLTGPPELGQSAVPGGNPVCRYTRTCGCNAYGRKDVASQ